MDTPEKNQIGTPISKFEDSPVFNYINSLSPIKPVKSIHITQTFNPLNFASLPSVFTSPHVNSHKEPRFLKRKTCLDGSKPEFSSGNGNKICTIEGIGMDGAQLFVNSAELQETFDPEVSLGEASVQASTEHSKFVIELPCTLKYDCGSPDCDPPPLCGTETGCVSDLVGKSALLVQNDQEASKKGSSEDEMHLSEMCRTGQKIEGMEGDWESLISDVSDLLIFTSPTDSEAFKELIEKSMDPMTRFSTSLMSQLQQIDINDVQMQIVDPTGSGKQHEINNPSAETGEANELQEIEQTKDDTADNLNKGMSSNTSEQMNSGVATCIPYASKAVSNLYRGMRRRCLDFEMVGARRKNLGDASNLSSSMLLQSDEKIACYDKQLVPIKPSGDSSRCILPGIGLHLNALATSSKDHKNVKHESLSSGKQLYLPSSTASLNSPTNSQEPLRISLTSVSSSERDTELAENGISHVEDVSQGSAYLVSDEFNQNSPKKKRRRLEHAGESESCKRCNCKKSKCLKLYCECFAAGVYCIEPCSCQECFNKPIHEDTVLATRKQIESRNPLAFAPKVIRSSESVTEIGDESSKTPASARHKRGCNCKKSNCLKKYCECYQGGVGCSIGCRCEGCKNAFGRKDESAPMGIEADQEEETDACENSVMDKALQKSDNQNNEEQNPASTLPTTPLRLSRPALPLPFSSNCKPPRSSFLTVGSSSGLYTSQKFGKPNILRSLPKFERHSKTVSEDEMPEILRGNTSPNTGIKSASPNRKRVSPPHSGFGSSPSRRSGRKLILQSIPSFPSLTPKH